MTTVPLGFRRGGLRVDYQRPALAIGAICVYLCSSVAEFILGALAPLLEIVNMTRRPAAQLNIRSAFARARVREIARRTGMTAKEIVEDALRGYVPPTEPEAVGSLVRRGPLLVFPAGKKRKITLAEAEAALDAVRGRRPRPQRSGSRMLT